MDDLLQCCEGVVGFECVSNLGHVGDLVAIKTVYSFIHLKHTPTYIHIHPKGGEIHPKPRITQTKKKQPSSESLLVMKSKQRKVNQRKKKTPKDWLFVWMTYCNFVRVLLVSHVVGTHLCSQQCQTVVVAC